VSALQSQVGGQHYLKLAIQPAEYSTRNGVGHMAGDAIAYITRYKDKNGKEDLLKAIHSIELLIQFEYPESRTRFIYWLSDDKNVLIRSEGEIKIDDVIESRWTHEKCCDWKQSKVYHDTMDGYLYISESEARKLVEDAGGTW
jgi:Protein of unknwon function (DUF3310)